MNLRLIFCFRIVIFIRFIGYDLAFLIFVVSMRSDLLRLVVICFTTGYPICVSFVDFSYPIWFVIIDHESRLSDDRFYFPFVVLRLPIPGGEVHIPFFRTFTTSCLNLIKVCRNSTCHRTGRGGSKTWHAEQAPTLGVPTLHQYGTRIEHQDN